MRKLIAFTLLSFFCLLLNNEKAISKSNCDVAIKATIAHHPVISTDTDMDTEALSGSLHQYDGFFKKL